MSYAFCVPELWTSDCFICDLGNFLVPKSCLFLHVVPKSCVRMPNSPAYVNTSSLSHFLLLCNRPDMCHHFSFNCFRICCCICCCKQKMVSEHVYFHVLKMFFCVISKLEKMTWAIIVAGWRCACYWYGFHFLPFDLRMAFSGPKILATHSYLKVENPRCKNKGKIKKRLICTLKKLSLTTFVRIWVPLIFNRVLI